MDTAKILTAASQPSSSIMVPRKTSKAMGVPPAGLAKSSHVLPSPWVWNLENALSCKHPHWNIYTIWAFIKRLQPMWPFLQFLPARELALVRCWGLPHASLVVSHHLLILTLRRSTKWQPLIMKATSQRTHTNTPKSHSQRGSQECSQSVCSPLGQSYILAIYNQKAFFFPFRNIDLPNALLL